jgi:hypothetical protein
MSLRNQGLGSIGKFLRPAQGDAVTAIDFVGGDSQPFCDDPAQPVDGKEAVVATHQNPVGTSGTSFRGEGSFMSASDWCRLLGRRPCRRHIAAKDAEALSDTATQPNVRI